MYGRGLEGVKRGSHDLLLCCSLRCPAWNLLTCLAVGLHDGGCTVPTTYASNLQPHENFCGIGCMRCRHDTARNM
jgi:hypothetical protein